MPRTHEAVVRALRTCPARRHLLDLAALLRRTLQRIRTVTEEFHLVLHTSPNTLFRSKSLGYWKTIDDDYHWHIEILPVSAVEGEVVHLQRSVLLAGDLRDRSQAAAGSENRRMSELGSSDVGLSPIPAFACRRTTCREEALLIRFICSSFCWRAA